jgi:phage terminase Nu1 subunit (DNA packaging protein)
VEDFAGTDRLSAMFGCSPQTVRELARRGVIAKSGKLFPVEESFRRYVAHLRAGAAARSGPAASSVATQRARLLKAQADKVERSSALAAGQLMPVAEVEARWTNLVRYLRNSMLMIPDRLPVAGEIALMVKREIVDALRDLSAGRDYGGVSLAPGAGGDEARMV